MTTEGKVVQSGLTQASEPPPVRGAVGPLSSAQGFQTVEVFSGWKSLYDNAVVAGDDEAKKRYQDLAKMDGVFTSEAASILMSNPMMRQRFGLSPAGVNSLGAVLKNLQEEESLKAQLYTTGLKSKMTEQAKNDASAYTKAFVAFDEAKTQLT